MTLSGYGSIAASYAAAPPAKLQAPTKNDKLDLKPSDGFASSQLPPGVGENLNIKA